MGYPVGHFNCKLDSKGRLMVPSELKEQLGAQVDEGFVLRPGLFESDHLELFTRQDWDLEQEKMRLQLSRFNRKHEAALRRYNEGVRFVKLDASGRMQIPKDLIETTSLVKEVIITSVTTKMEIWDKNLYKQSIANEIDDEEFFNILENIK